MTPWRDGEQRTIGSIKWKRVQSLDRRFRSGDDYAGDAFVRWVAVGQQPENWTAERDRLLAEKKELVSLVEAYHATADDPLGMTKLAELDAKARAVLAKVKP